MKLSVFYEGDCEGILLKQFFYNYRPSVKSTEDIIEFKDSAEDMVLLYNCGGYQSVFPSMLNYIYLHKPIECHFIALRDTEKSPCYISLKNEAESKIGILNSQTTKWAIFSKPNIEALYAADIDLLIKVVTSLYKETHGGGYPNQLKQDLLHANLHLGKTELERIFKIYKISFNKKKIATKFFSQFNFEKTNEPFFIRFKSLFP